MPRRPGLCVLLSFGIVALAATVLPRPEHAPTNALPTRSQAEVESVAVTVPMTSESEPLPPPTEGQPWATASGPVEAADRPPAWRCLSGRAFATVEPGEALADVARRVYGSSAAVDHLWQANRDLLTRPTEPLASGQVVRTP